MAKCKSLNRIGGKRAKFPSQYVITRAESGTLLDGWHASNFLGRLQTIYIHTYKT